MDGWMVLDRGLGGCTSGWMVCIRTEADGFAMLRLRLTSVCLILDGTNERVLTQSSREEWAVLRIYLEKDKRSSGDVKLEL